MTKLTITLLLVAASLFGQGGDIMKELHKSDITAGQKAIPEIEKHLTEHAKAARTLTEAINNPSPTKVRLAYEEFWRLNLTQGQHQRRAEILAKLVRMSTETLTETQQITNEETMQAQELAKRLDELSKKTGLNPTHHELIRKTYEYAFKASKRAVANLDKTIAQRTKAAKELSKKLAENDPVKTGVYADRMMSAHEQVQVAAKSIDSLGWIFWHAEFEFKDNVITEKSYDQAKELKTKLDESEKGRFAPKDQLAIFQKAAPQKYVSFVLKM